MFVQVTGSTGDRSFLALLMTGFAAAALASWLPARRACRVEPATVLRTD